VSTGACPAGPTSDKEYPVKWIRKWTPRLIRIEEHWFEIKPVSAGADIVRLFNVYSPVDGFSNQESHTRLIDLTRDEDVIFGDMHKNTRYEIKRADQESVEFEVFDENVLSVLAEFGRDYASLQSSKGLEAMRMDRLEALQAKGSLVVTVATTGSPALRSWHVYVRGADRVRLLYSVSAFRDLGDKSVQAQAARANRWHHWMDLKHWKSKAVAFYDFGGEYIGTEDRQKMGISTFKRNFGGDLAPTYSGVRAVTAKGRLALALRQVVSGRN
jgi:hypothetical protein